MKSKVLAFMITEKQIITLGYDGIIIAVRDVSSVSLESLHRLSSLTYKTSLSVRIAVFNHFSMTIFIDRKG